MRKNTQEGGQDNTRQQAQAAACEVQHSRAQVHASPGHTSGVVSFPWRQAVLHSPQLAAHWGYMKAVGVGGGGGEIAPSMPMGSIPPAGSRQGQRRPQCPLHFHSAPPQAPTLHTPGLLSQPPWAAQTPHCVACSLSAQRGRVWLRPVPVRRAEGQRGTVSLGGGRTTISWKGRLGAREPCCSPPWPPSCCSRSRCRASWSAICPRSPPLVPPLSSRRCLALEPPAAPPCLLLPTVVPACPTKFSFSSPAQRKRVVTAQVGVAPC